MKIGKNTFESNYVRIMGVVEKDLEISLIDPEEKFYETILAVPREDGQNEDYIPIILSKRKEHIKKGDKVYIKGEIRKHKVPGENQKIISQTSIFVYYISKVEDIFEPLNDVFLQGTIIEEPYYKEKYNQRYATIVLEVSRRFDKKDYISAYAVGVNADEIIKMHKGDKIEILGRIQSRYVPNKKITFREVFIKKIYKI